MLITRYVAAAATAMGAALLIAACGQQAPVTINYGTDTCDWCGQTITDEHFGAALISTDGKVFKFDSNECLMAFHLEPTIPRETFKASFVTDYTNPGTLMRAGPAFMVYAPGEPTPAGIGIFAFSSKLEARKFADDVNGMIHEWDELPPYVEDGMLAKDTATSR